ncbi:chemotaxis protein CheW [Pannonibacter sp.]|uniref:chemotaxis protein CheW n=1 Tax=Pannonibacter sp. TaxID=1906786 RepID=UPI003F727B35
MEHIEYLLATLSGTRLALPLDLVLSVNEPAPVTPLPFCPRHVQGLVFVQDRVMPLMDLASLLGLPARSPASPTSLVILANGDDVRALEVDHVVAMVAVDASALQTRADPESATSFLAQRLSARGEDWLVLDYVRLATDTRMDAEGLIEDGALVPADPVGLADLEERQEDTAVDRIAHLLIDIGADRYALPTTIISEVLEPVDLRPMPAAPAWVAGLMQHQETPLLVVRADVLLSPDTQADHASVATTADSIALRIVDPATGRAFALLADRAPGLLSLSPDEIFSTDDAIAGISRYAVVDDRILAIIEPLALVGERLADVERLTPQGQGQSLAQMPMPDGAAARAAAARPGHRFLTLRIRDEFFAIDLDRVDSILSTVRLSPLPDGGNGFDGLADAGDKVVPVLDLHRRLTGQPSPDDTPPCVLLQLEGSTAGLAVDQVLRIEDVAAEDIDEVAEQTGLPVHAVARVRDRLMAVLTLDRLLPRRIH